MSFQAPICISDVVSRIRKCQLLLPAIQREFVWGPEKVEWLFDSLLQDYPIGSFLFWEVRDDASKEEPYYELLREFRERYRIHNPEFNAMGHVDFDAVLDGQQRLTALYIGLTGSYAYKKPRVWWEDSERNLPTRWMYLNIKGQAPDDNDEQTGRVYEFKFLTADEYSLEPTKWFRIDRILNLVEAHQLIELLNAEFRQNEFATKALSKLHSVVHIERIINYYSIRNADTEKALNVFVRVNSGGEPLSLSDILMSTMIANWERDARKEVHGLVEQVQAKGFFIDKDLVLKACLYLYNSDIRYKVSNFKAANVKPIEDNWDAIQASVLAVFGLVKDFGYSQSSLTSKNALLPIIYWVHHKGLAKGITSQVQLRGEREIIRPWLHAVLLKGVFGSSADTILAAIRKAFVGEKFDKPFIKPEIEHFPTQAIAMILRSQNKDPLVTDEFIDSLLYTQYDEKQAFTILSLLAPTLDYRNGNFHKDHLHPASTFKKKLLVAAGISDKSFTFYHDPTHWNSILNLSFLDASENQSKQDTSLAEWVSKESQKQKVSETKFCVDHLLLSDSLPEDRLLPSDLSLLKFSRFPDFIANRHKLLGQRLRELLSVSG